MSVWSRAAQLATAADLAVFGVPCTLTHNGETTEFIGNLSERTARRVIDGQTGFEKTVWERTLIVRRADVPDAAIRPYSFVTADGIRYQIVEIDAADHGAVRLVLGGQD